MLLLWKAWHARLKGRRWDRIVGNFPYAGALPPEAGLNYY